MNSKMSILQGHLTHFKRSKIHDLFKNVAFLEPNIEALIYEENNQTRIHTFEELDNLSSNLANIIIQTVNENGLHSERNENFIIGVHMPPSDYLLITLLGIWKAGASYLPLDPSYPPDRIDYIISDTKPALVIYNQENGNFINTTFKLCITDLILSDRDVKIAEREKIALQESDSAVILYTSGSTGHPKGVCLSHTTILNRLQWQYKNFPFKETEKVGVFKTALPFVDSIFEIWGPLLKGRAVLVLPKQTVQNPEKLIQSLEKYKIQRIVLVPSLLESIVLYKDVSGKKIILPDLNLWISSGEILSKILVNKFYNHFEIGKNALCNFFGSTEVVDFTFHVITHPKQLDKYDSFPLGVAVDNTEVYILDSNKNIVPEGEAGEIYASGLNLPLKYISEHNQDKIVQNDLFPNAKKFSRLCKTGDIGQIKDNLLFFLGRTDSVIKIRGFRVDLIEIEKVINSIEGVRKCVVLCYKSGDINQTILAFVQNADEVTTLEIEQIVKTKLPSHMVPKVLCIKTFPFLINGKVDRQLLLKKYDENKDKLGIDYAGVSEDQLPAAKILFETIASLAAGQSQLKITLKSNFFEVGGNSLNSIHAVMVLKNNGYHIGINNFIKSANLQEVLNKIVVSTGDESFMSDQSTDYLIEQMEERHKDEVFKIVASSFVEKSNVETLVEGITVESYYELLEHVWPATLRDEISFVVKSKNGSIIAASINFNADTNFNYTLKSNLAVVDEFFFYLEDPIKEDLLKKYNKVCYSLLLATRNTLTPQENVLLVHFMEQQIIKLAKNKDYEGIFTSNQIPITEDIGNMFGYISYLDYQINQYVTKDNVKPFQKAPDSQKVTIHFKKL